MLDFQTALTGETKYRLTLPYPVSVNIYWKSRIAYKNGKAFIVHYVSTEGKAYKEFVKAKYGAIKPCDFHVAISMILHPKQNKDGSASLSCQDLDNGLKCILDSLEGIVYLDDKQIRRYDEMDYGAPIPNGGVTIFVRRKLEPANKSQLF